MANQRTTIPVQYKKRIKRLIPLSRLNLFIERLWPTLLPLLGVVAMFFIISWFGFWLDLSTVLRVIALCIFSIGALAAVYPLLKLRMPSQSDALARIEACSNINHRLLSSLDDDPVDLQEDNTNSNSLWREAQIRLAEKLRRAKVGWPRLTAAAEDPLQFRAVIILVLVVAFNYAGDDRQRRVASALEFSIQREPVLARIDAWITPPEYTQAPPIFLTHANFEDGDKLKVPIGSVFTLQSDTPDAIIVEVITTHSTTDVKPFIAASSSSPASDQVKFETELSENAILSVRSDFGKAKEWEVNIIEDNSPQISFEGLPKATTRGALELSYNLIDDYGIESAFAQIKSTNKSVDSQPLYEIPKLDLSLPRRLVKQGTGTTIENLSEHPFAGTGVSLILNVIDQAGQQGRSIETELNLPIRPFAKPLAKALIEQRQLLAFDAHHAFKARLALDALLFAPELYIQSAPIFLTLDMAHRRLITAKNDDDLRQVVDLLWESALAIEDGDLSDLERRLRDAQDKLSDALENDASDEEIAKLAEELRQAMNQYLEALARQMQENLNTQQAMPFNPNTPTMTPEQLNEMLNQMESLAKSGSKQAAQDLLAQMKRTLENLQAGSPRLSEQQQQMQEMLSELSDLVEKQQKLMDETFQEQQRQDRNQQQLSDESSSRSQQEDQAESNGPRSNPEQSSPSREPNERSDPSDSQQQADEGGEQEGKQGELSDLEKQRAQNQLQQGQADIHDGLQAMLDEMQQNGFRPGENFGEADSAMGDSAQALGSGQLGDAIGSQSQALQALRDSMQNLMQQFAQQGSQNGQQGGQTQSMMPPVSQNPGNPNGTDPLGRSQNFGPEDGNSVKVPGEIETQRAREVLEAIRKRLGEFTRPGAELDYLERLLP